MNITVTWAQNTLVPYRVGDKFGLSNLQGAIKLEAQFDIIDQLYAKTNYFNAYKISDNSSTVSFIHNDKILVKDQPFTNYRVDENFIFGYKQPDTTYFHINNSAATLYLFDLSGRAIFANNLKFVSFLNTYEALQNTTQLLMLLTNNKGKMQLVVWNKSTQKIEKTLLDNMNYVDHNLEKNYNNYKFDLQYLTATKQYRKLIIEIEHGEIKVLEDIEIKTNKKPDSDDEWYASTYSIGSDYKSDAAKPYATKSELQEEEYIAIIEETYQTAYPRKKDIIFRNKLQQREHQKVKIFKEGKSFGLKQNNDSIILEPIYEVVYSGELYSAIVKKDGLYGLYLYNRKPNVLIEPKFKYIPVISKWLYQQQDGYIFKLYNEDGSFFCYANQNGTIYFSSK